MAIKTMMTELKWFLKGDTNIKYLVDNNCNIWNGDAWKAYLEDNKDLGATEENATKEWFVNKIKNDNYFASVWGELGPVYGKQWRDFEGVDQLLNLIDEIKSNPTSDQIQNLINELKTNPDSRRLMVSAWNVGELNQMTLPPCHYGFQVYTRELSFHERWSLYSDKPTRLTTREEKIVNPGKYRAISLMWNQRSVDTFLGLPFNIASYAALLCLIAEEVGMIPGELIGNLGDTHLYSNHVEQAREQMERTSFELPTIEIHMSDILNGEFDYELNDYKHHPTIKAPLSN